MKGMKGEIFDNVLDLISNCFIQQEPIKGHTIGRCCGTISYRYWLCCIFTRAGYFERIQNGSFKVVKNPKNLKSLKQLRLEAYEYDRSISERCLELF